jgi:hypothetical protein
VSPEENRAIVRRLMEDAYTNPEVHDVHVADEYVGRLPPNPTLRGPEGLKRFNAEAARPRSPTSTSPSRTCWPMETNWWFGGRCAARTRARYAGTSPPPRPTHGGIGDYHKPG